MEWQQKEQQREKLSFYHGTRDISFYNLIKGLLKRGKIKEHYIQSLLTVDSMKEYNNAFTSSTITSYLNTTTNKVEINVNSSGNYEIYEKLGDGVFDCFIGFYPFRRFPEMTSVKDVKVIHMIRSTYGSRKQFAPIAERLGFWNFISSNMFERNHHKEKLLEDVFEAFLGCTCNILDNAFKVGVGFGICYDILKSIFDEMDISTEFEEMQDYKSKLNEIMMKNKQLGKLFYEFNRDEKMAYSIIYRVTDYGRYELGRGTGSKKPKAEQVAAKNALTYLKTIGIE